MQLLLAPLRARKSETHPRRSLIPNFDASSHRDMLLGIHRTRFNMSVPHDVLEKTKVSPRHLHKRISKQSGWSKDDTTTVARILASKVIQRALRAWVTRVRTKMALVKKRRRLSFQDYRDLEKLGYKGFDESKRNQSNEEDDDGWGYITGNLPRKGL